MTTTLALLVAAGVAAVVDWVAADRLLFRLEYVVKPLTLALLVAAAATAGLGEAKPWVVAALALGLLGDVAIMLAAPRGADRWFFTALVAFFLGHVAYVVGFMTVGVRLLPLLAGLLVAAGVGGLILPEVLRRTREAGSGLAVAVAGYSLAVGAMAGFAAGTQLIATAIGGALFVVSDALLSRERFADPVRRSKLLVAVTYHLAQFLIVIGVLVAA